MTNLQRETTSKSIAGISDLVVWAPIRPGFIKAFENITYESRLKLTAEALHKVRVSAREHELIAPFPDTAERILSLLNFRIGVLDDKLFTLASNHKLFDFDRRGTDSSATFVSQLLQSDAAIDLALDALIPRRYMYLIATFDGPWEPYMRLIWKPLGPFLDLLLCNCLPYHPVNSPDGYKLAQASTFEEYAAWVHEHQLDPSIFYSTTGLTVRDHLYLSKLEQLQRTGDPATSDREIARMTHDLPEVTAAKVQHNELLETIRLGFEALTVLYRLADYYPPYVPPPSGTPDEPVVKPRVTDGRLLLRAAGDLLSGFLDTFARLRTINPLAYGELSKAYAEPLAWFGKAVDQAPTKMTTPRDFPPNFPVTEIQKGILSSYDRPGVPITDGALLYFQITDKNAAQAYLRELSKYIDWESGPNAPPADGEKRVRRNIAFTFDGLQRLDLPEKDLLAFPKAFRDGSRDRAPTIGDARENHPRAWKLPPRNWPPTDDSTEPPIGQIEPPIDPVDPSTTPPNPLFNAPIDLSEIDFVVQLRTTRPLDGMIDDFDFVDFSTVARTWFELSSVLGLGVAARGAASPAAEDGGVGETAGMADLAQFETETGVALLGYESMIRAGQPGKPAGDQPGEEIDHFGFRDGLSQPIVDPTLSAPLGDAVPPGDLICGYRNSLTDPDWKSTRKPGRALLDRGSFLVVRKMSQDRAALDEFVAQTQRDNPDLTRAEILGAMMGRKPDGDPLVAPGTIDNKFDYAGDATGEKCPFAAHIRRANPRDTFQGRPTPRILRRGMSYGYRYNSPKDADKPRGSVFMAYMANIAEQYEVLQRWINGGNATRVASAQHDPVTGIAPDSGPVTFRFVAKDKVRRVVMTKPFVGLEYTLYLFAPSKAALKVIGGHSNMASPHREDTINPDQAQEVAAGEQICKIINGIKSAKAKRDEWKRVLEDFFSKDPAETRDGINLWAYVRSLGALRIDGVSKAQAAAAGKHPCPPVPAHGGSNKPDEKPTVLVATRNLVEHVLSHPELFSSCEQGGRTANSFGDIFVAMDPGKNNRRYERESKITNKTVWEYSESPVHQEEVFQAAYQAAAKRLVDVNPLRLANFKLELRRELIMPVLGTLCSGWFDIPDEKPEDPAVLIELGGWGWGEVDQSGSATPVGGQRKPRCPGDFMAPSRYCFYPQPTPTISDFGVQHGRALKKAGREIVRKKRKNGQVAGAISKQMYDQIKDTGDGKGDALLARNLIGIMEGMLPPTDGILRGIIYEWLDRNTLWRHQGALHRATKGKPATYQLARQVLERPVEKAICKRPAPDLIYRTALKRTELTPVIGGNNLTSVWVEKGDRVVLGLMSAMQDPPKNLRTEPTTSPVFGGHRALADHPPHACPARGMVMAMIYGILSALLDCGQILAQPSSLIIEINKFPAQPVPMPPPPPSP